MLKRLANRAAPRVTGVLSLARRVSSLGASPVARMKLFAVAVGLGARWLLHRPSTRLWELNLSWFGGRRKFVVSDFGELQVMREIVLYEEYAVPGIDPETILDLGANIGLTSAWFRGRYPAARIVAVEPDPDTFAKLERNLGGDDAVTLVQAAVAGEPGEVDLFRPPGYSITSSISEAHADVGSSTRVRACTIDELCAEHGLGQLDLLKLDVEGAELDALDGFRHLDDVGTIIGEVHRELIDAGVDAFFERLGAFEVERTFEDSWAIGFIARRPRNSPPPIDRSGRLHAEGALAENADRP
jgi:FkbM family methyltransferase